MSFLSSIQELQEKAADQPSTLPNHALRLLKEPAGISSWTYTTFTSERAGRVAWLLFSIACFFSAILEYMVGDY